MRRDEGPDRLSYSPVSVYVTIEQEAFLKTLSNKASWIRDAIAKKIARESRYGHERQG